jgi:hypothetical protein
VDVPSTGVAGAVVPTGGGPAGSPRSSSRRESDRPSTSLAPGEHLGFDAVGLADADDAGIADLLAVAAEGDTVAVIAGEPSA